jgi:tetratricopeptide (TPR) repeat protein
MRILALSVCVAIVGAAAPARADELDALAKAIDEHPEDPKAYDAYALAALRAKRYDDVIKKVKNGTARIPDYTQGYYWLALAYRSKKEWADAADYYRRYIEKNPNKTDPWFGLGASLEGLGDKKGAIAAYDKYISLEKAPDKQRFVDIAKQEVAKLDESRAPKPAEAAPTPSAPPAPAPPPQENAGALRLKADQLRHAGKLEEAAQAYQVAIDADRGNVELYNELGNVYFTIKKYDQAAEQFRQATARDPNYALGWYNLAHALRKADKKAEAVQAYRQYMRLKPDDPDPYYGLGQTLKALGDVPGAIEAFRKYVAMEKRPDEQRWVEKARQELEALEAMQKSSSTGGAQKIQEKDAGDSAVQDANRSLDRDLGRTPRDPDGLMNPFIGPYSRSERDLRDPFDHQGRLNHDLKNPFDADGVIAPPSLMTPSTPADQRMREYGAALDAYRRALAQQAEVVSERYERGAAYASVDNRQAAARLWNSVPLTDSRLEAAKKSVERVRAQLAQK